MGMIPSMKPTRCYPSACSLRQDPASGPDGQRWRRRQPPVPVTISAKVEFLDRRHQRAGCASFTSCCLTPKRRRARYTDRPPPPSAVCTTRRSAGGDRRQRVSFAFRRGLGIYPQADTASLQQRLYPAPERFSSAPDPGWCDISAYRRLLPDPLRVSSHHHQIRSFNFFRRDCITRAHGPARFNFHPPAAFFGWLQSLPPP